jgi:hypothetical protein
LDLRVLYVDGNSYIAAYPTLFFFSVSYRELHPTALDLVSYPYQRFHITARRLNAEASHNDFLRGGNGNSSGIENPSVTREEKVNKAKNILGVQENGGIIRPDADDQLLITFGYRPELRRNFSYLTTFGQSFGAMGIAPAIAESIIFSLGSAGVPGMVWTYLVGCILLIPVALSLGELGSAMPTAGGLYYVSSYLTENHMQISDLYDSGSRS